MIKGDLEKKKRKETIHMGLSESEFSSVSLQVTIAPTPFFLIMLSDPNDLVRRKGTTYKVMNGQQSSDDLLGEIFLVFSQT